jgi:hypothetical protein
MKKFANLLFTALFVSALSACAPSAPTTTATTTEMPTATLSPSPTATSTPVPPLKGRLFFDMNGSGLPDETSFTYDPERLVDPRQPLQPDLAKAVDEYKSAHPDLKNGDLITIEEPGLSGYSVCILSDCVQTDAQGNFSLPNSGRATSVSIKITDPNADNPALAMRYINNWKGAVVVPAYTKDVDTPTMARLTTIPGCDADLVALVCKLDAAKLQVRDQNLNDTNIISIVNGTSIKSGQDNNIGLMVGFLTLPFVSEQVPKPFVMNYFDILGNFWSDDAGKNTISNNQDGVMLNYNGKYNTEVDWRRVAAGEYLTGVGDSHPGVDFLLPIGNYIVSILPTATIFHIFSGNQTDPELRIYSWFEDPANPGEYYEGGGAHLNVILGILDHTVYRGQIIGLSGDSGIYPPGTTQKIQQDHFGLSKRITEGWIYFDPFRTIITLNPIPANYGGSPVSWWTSDNLAQFSR